MDALLPIINQLQVVFKNTGTEEVKLPQIVVTGAQSCGKSSVLESLVRKSFLPRGTGIVTRCPIILQMHQVQSGEDEYAEILTEPADPSQFNYTASIRYTDYDDLQVAIEDRTNEVAGSNKGISKTPIIVRIFASDVISLTVVDLPGIVKVPTGDQPHDIEFQVKDLIMQYISNENAIILAVCPGNQDLATSESLKIAKEVDPDGERTLAVITKLDLLDKGQTAAKELEGLVIPIKLGIIGVINRSQHDLVQKKSVEDALRDEIVQLEADYPLLQGRIGSVYLAKRLNQLLLEHIRKCLPTLKARINALKNEQNALLRNYGTKIPSKLSEKMRLMIEVILNFERDYGKTIEERSSLIGGLKYAEGDNVPLASSAQIADSVLDYCTEMEKIDALSGVETKHIKKMIKQTTNWEQLVSIEDVFKTLAKQQIILLEKPCQNFASRIHSILQNTIEQCSKDGRIPKLNAEIGRVMRTHLDENLSLMESTVIKAMLEEHSLMIFSRTEEYTTLLQHSESKSKNGVGVFSFSNPNTTANGYGGLGLLFLDEEAVMIQIRYIEQLVQAYFNSVRKNIIDVLPKRCMYLMYRQTMFEFHESIGKSIDDNVESLMIEPESIILARKKCELLLKSLNAAADIVNRLRGFCID